MFRNILVSIDGSPHSDRALQEAIDLVEASNGRLTVITAVPRPTSWVNSTVTATATQSLMADLERESHEIMRRALDRVPASVPVTKIVTRDPIRSALADRISVANHDLLVMGSRGRGALSASLLGSVSHFALNHIKVPVLIVHTDGEQDPVSEPVPKAAVAPV